MRRGGNMSYNIDFENFEDFLKWKSRKFNSATECTLSNLFANEQTAEVLVSFLVKYKKYGTQKEQMSIQDFLDGINFYKENKIFFGEEEE